MFQVLHPWVEEIVGTEVTLGSHPRDLNREILQQSAQIQKHHLPAGPAPSLLVICEQFKTLCIVLITCNLNAWVSYIFYGKNIKYEVFFMFLLFFFCIVRYFSVVMYL